MVEILPLPSDVDPAQRYSGTFAVGRPDLQAVIGSGAGGALKDMEVGAYSSARSVKPGAATTDNVGTSLAMGFVRMKDVAAATAAVSDPAVFAEEAPFGAGEFRKRPVAVPGYSEAKAYQRNGRANRPASIVALHAHGRFVLFAYTTASVDVVKKFLDLLSGVLNDFAPTPAEKFNTLPKDRENLLQYTVAGDASRDVVLPARAAVVNQSDIPGSVTNFADAGVDYVARAANTVYRARDAAGATVLADRFIAEMKGFFPDAVESTVKGVPRGRCVIFSPYKGASDFRSYCVVPVGRYLAEASSAQAENAKQAIGASYLILLEAK